VGLRAVLRREKNPNQMFPSKKNKGGGPGQVLNGRACLLKSCAVRKIREGRKTAEERIGGGT